MIYIIYSYIPLLIASTGSNLDAEMAGKIPEISPINAASEHPKIMFLKLKINSKSNNEEAPSAISQTKNSPTIPPKRDKIIASNKN